LRKARFEIVEPDCRKIEIEQAVRFGRKLFCHQRLSARDRLPVDVALGFAPHVWTNPGEIIALSKLSPRAALPRTRSLGRQSLIAGRFWINNVTLRTRELFQRSQKTEWIETTQVQSPDLMLAPGRGGESKHDPGGFAGGNFVDAFVTSTGNEASWPANAGLIDSAVACKPPRLESVRGIETRKTLMSANKSRYDAALF
jgi:hypothetical protein